MNGLAVPPEDLLVADVIGIDSGEGFERDGQLREWALAGKGEDGNADEGSSG